MYQLDVVNGFSRLTEDDICCQLRRICKMADEDKSDSGGIGILTSLPRSDWARSRQKLKTGTKHFYFQQVYRVPKRRKLQMKAMTWRFSM